MTDEHAKVRWSKVRDAIYGKLTKAKSNDQNGSNISTGIKTFKPKEDILRHGKIIAFLLDYCTILIFFYF